MYVEQDENLALEESHLPACVSPLQVYFHLSPRLLFVSPQETAWRLTQSSRNISLPVRMEPSQNAVVGLIGMGEMGRMYADRLAAAGNCQLRVDSSILPLLLHLSTHTHSLSLSSRLVLLTLSLCFHQFLQTVGM
jgi:hypothetical protein